MIPSADAKALDRQEYKMDKTKNEIVDAFSKALDFGLSPKDAACVAEMDETSAEAISEAITKLLLSEEYDGSAKDMIEIIAKVYDLKEKDGVGIFPLGGESWRVCDGIDVWDEDGSLEPEDIFNNIDGDDYRSFDEDGDGETFWLDIDCSITLVNYDGEQIFIEASETLTFHPVEPDCSDDEHIWKSPFEVLGGIEENPGVWGNGGGVIIKRVCPKCGQYKIIDTWAQNPENGIQGLESIKYQEPDEESLAWVEKMQSEKD